MNCNLIGRKWYFRQNEWWIQRNRSKVRMMNRNSCYNGFRIVIIIFLNYYCWIFIPVSFVDMEYKRDNRGSRCFSSHSDDEDLHVESSLFCVLSMFMCMQYDWRPDDTSLLLLLYSRISFRILFGTLISSLWYSGRKILSSSVLIIFHPSSSSSWLYIFINLFSSPEKV